MRRAEMITRAGHPTHPPGRAPHPPTTWPPLARAGRRAWRRGDTVSVSAGMIPFQAAGEKPTYTLRIYPPFPSAATTYTNRGSAYLALGSYMSGENASGTRFPETQPILMHYDYARGDTPEEKEMLVYLEGGDETGAPPAPTDPSVRLDVGGGELIAAVKFDGNATQEACERYYLRLLETLKADVGSAAVPADDRITFTLAQYGPLHSLTPRLNEVWIRVKL